MKRSTAITIFYMMALIAMLGSLLSTIRNVPATGWPIAAIIALAAASLLRKKKWDGE